MTLTEFQRRAIGVPFVPFGRDYDGWDCWGLCIVAYRDVLGVALPDFTYESTRRFSQLARLFGDRRNPYWRTVDAVPLSIACIFRRGVVIHAGLVVPNRRILHVEEGVETCAPLVSTFRVEGYYAPSSCYASVQGCHG